ncbi:MAG: hypothetical protein ACRC2O_03100, partial [Chitinophagaceae bacterium]
MKTGLKLFHTPFFIKLFNWEYWPFMAIYAWVFPYWGYLCLRSRSFYFFNASNPGIENGGLLNESKKDIHALLPIDLYPSSLHFSIPADPEKVWQDINLHDLKFPVMGKPDIGGRGRGIKKLLTKTDLDFYVKHATLDFHIQAFVPFEKEVGIFYYRYPGQQKGNISGIVSKEFLTVTGDGKCTVKELLQSNSRGTIYLQSLSKNSRNELNMVPDNGKEIIVSPYGNHARGSKFLDDSHLADQALTDQLDRIADKIPEFYFGRLDIRFKDWESFKKGEQFSLIEVNGAGAEPTHMYDPKHSIFFAWKEITRHWRIMNKISRMNHKRGVPYLSFADGREVFRKDKEISAKLEKMPS